MKPRERLARLHCINTLFHSLTGHDLYLASQVLEAVEAAAAENPDMANNPAAFSDTLEHLHRTLTGCLPEAAFTYLDGATPGVPGPLWLRNGLLHALRRHATAPQSTVFVTNADATGRDQPQTGTSAHRKRKQARERAETITHLRDLTARRANPRSLVTLLVV